MNVLPPGFMANIKDKGLTIPWCNQRAVLSNTTIEGFLTHCGFGTRYWSIWYGVPEYVVDDWNARINLCEKGPISKDRVAETINSLMNGTISGNLIKQNMKKMSKIVHDAVAKDGSSTMNLDHSFKDLKTKICTRSNDKSVSFQSLRNLNFRGFTPLTLLHFSHDCKRLQCAGFYFNL
ncbi:UNVERIFIED_CONTAM: hypothetical protein Slati_0934400 [Sesamum latifolium]|uniref:Uncharacterized protein n=1 Tax=Sesamum latifolium TaxID=2727402 RepID=A0AAW2XP73_9LAMI